LKGVSIPAYGLDHQFPVVAVVGIHRPCLFVATRLLDSLPPEELAAVVAHEMGHLASRDNLRRLLLLLCPDVRALLRMNPDAPWMDAAETAADSFAVRHEQRVPLDLAAALINVSRAIPEGATIANTPLIQLLIPDSKSGVAERVLRLLSVSQDDISKRSKEWSNRAKALTACLPLTAAVLAFWTSPACLRATHSLLENIVRILS
jgi:Zn-dependent protease with chaperone function